MKARSCITVQPSVQNRSISTHFLFASVACALGQASWPATRPTPPRPVPSFPNQLAPHSIITTARQNNVMLNVAQYLCFLSPCPAPQAGSTLLHNRQDRIYLLCWLNSYVVYSSFFYAIGLWPKPIDVKKKKTLKLSGPKRP